MVYWGIGEYVPSATHFPTFSFFQQSIFFFRVGAVDWLVQLRRKKFPGQSKLCRIYWFPFPIPEPSNCPKSEPLCAPLLCSLLPAPCSAAPAAVHCCCTLLLSLSSLVALSPSLLLWVTAIACSFCLPVCAEGRDEDPPRDDVVASRGVLSNCCSRCTCS